MKLPFNKTIYYLLKLSIITEINTEVFLHYIYCAIKFVYVVEPSIIIETAYLVSALSFSLQMWQNQLSQGEEITNKKSAPGHCRSEENVLLNTFITLNTYTFVQNLNYCF